MTSKRLAKTVAAVPEPGQLPAWIRPSVAARLLGIHQSTVTYRAGTKRYRTKRRGDVTLVSRDDVLRDVAAQAA